ncbi:37S ribosomal protein Mrp17 [Phaeosphaeriaceae sp. PMI808]|nr:37S ribosomal protein Mrp17 [Phaeosphaeriaceae sp. PMI808]
MALAPADMYDQPQVRPGRLSEVKEIAKTAGTIILSQRGVVRGYSNWGTFLLPKPAKKLQSTHHYGHHFIMRFDASARAQHALRRTMSLDPRLIRYSVVKMGEKFEHIKDVQGVATFR